MKRSTLTFGLVLALSLAASVVWTQEKSVGQVQLPLEIYKQLIEQAQGPDERPAPVNYALGSAQVNVRVDSVAERPSAEVNVTLSIQVFENEWALVPVLPAGTPVTRAAIQGSAVQLVATPLGLAWTTNKEGAYTMTLSYRVDAASTEGGYVLGLPVPQAASINLNGTLPGTGLDVAVIPAAGIRTSASGASTQVLATVPTTSGVQISWRTPSRKGPSFSRAVYRGELSGDAVVWTGDFRVELFGDETATVPLLPRTVTLTNLLVDGKEAAILVEKKQFATLVRGRGVHRVVASFQTPVVLKDGPPRVELRIPRVPVSRFELSLPGQKEVSASPASNVTTRVRGGATTAVVNVPLTDAVSLSWSEAVPEVARRELRANASLYHVIHAEEGVLNVRARVLYEVRRGETHRLELEVPQTVQVNDVESESGAVSDWRVVTEGNRRVLHIFLDRAIQKELWVDIDYDRSLGEGDAEALPLLTARGVGRQRGMIALLSSRDLTLEPTDEGDATRVGENQLPGPVRDGIEMTVAHTFKYTDTPPAMTASATVPERVVGRFDAQVDTLLSLGDVTLTGASTVELHVKSGGVDRLELVLPEEANLLNLTAPSLRTHRVSDDDPRAVELEFTQDLEGDFRIELSYERLLDQREEFSFSTPRVRGSDVEGGRIAIEALSAVEISPTATQELTPLDPDQLPRQLILRTTNPILHAFKYVRAVPEPRLSLRVTRHRVADVQEAAIDHAEYRTLFTRDGLAVTTVRFAVRNQRKQFLRVRLPEDSDIWSVFVAGRAEKPALGEEGRTLLIKIVNSADDFPVDLIYATRRSTIGSLGTIRAELPQPDILVTETKWNLFLPRGLQYSRPSTNLTLVTEGTTMTAEQMKRELAGLEDHAASPNVVKPLRITVPATGIHYAFEKLYANQGDVQAYVSLPYASTSGAISGQLLSLLGVGLVWVGAWRSERFSKRMRIILVATGAMLLTATVGILHVSAVPALLLSLVLVGVQASPHARRMLEELRASRTAEQRG